MSAPVIPASAWAKQKPLGEALLAMARDLGPNQRMPTVREVCRSFGVSTSTLDPVLRSLESRGAIVRQHGRGIFVSPKIHERTIGVVFGGDIFSHGFSPFWSLLLQAVREQAGLLHVEPRAYLDISRGHGGLEGHAQLVEDLDERRVHGLLLLSPRTDYDQTGQLRAYGVPLVVFGGELPGWSVTLDWDPFFARAAQELAAHGCRRVALMGHSMLARCPMLERALQRDGVADVSIADWSYETWARVIPGAGTREHCAYRLTQQMLAARTETPLPDMVVSTDDTMTHGMITALWEAGLQPDRDLQVVTATNKGSPVLEPYAAALFQVEYDPADSVRAALAMLETLMNGGTPAQNPVRIAPRVSAAVKGGTWRVEGATAGNTVHVQRSTRHVQLSTNHGRVSENRR